MASKPIDGIAKLMEAENALWAKRLLSYTSPIMVYGVDYGCLDGFGFFDNKRSAPVIPKNFRVYNATSNSMCASPYAEADALTEIKKLAEVYPGNKYVAVKFVADAYLAKPQATVTRY